jgi:proline iminopeptidase
VGVGANQFFSREENDTDTRGVTRRMSTSKLYIDPAHVAAAEKDDWAKFACLSSNRTDLYSPFFKISAFARIENHYFVNDSFMRDGQLLDSQEIDKM